MPLAWLRRSRRCCPPGVRHRQLTAGTLLAGMMLTLEDDRPAHLTRVHAALTALPEPDQARLGVTEEWRTGPHHLTCRQVERTFNLVVAGQDRHDAGPGAADGHDDAAGPAGHVAAADSAGRRGSARHRLPGRPARSRASLRYRIFHAAARLTREARRRRLKTAATWPWASAITTGWEHLSAFPQAP